MYRAAADVVAIPLDTLTALYHRASGTTHLVASPAPEILAALSGEGLSRDALAARLAADYELGEADGLDARLGELVDAGLVVAA